MKQLIQRVRIGTAALFTAALIGGAVPLAAAPQEGDETKQMQYERIRTILKTFKNFRYGNVSIFDCESQVPDLNLIFGPSAPEETPEAMRCNAQDEIQAYVNGELSEDDVRNYLRRPECKAFEKYYRDRMVWESNQFDKAYLVTSRYVEGTDPDVIGLLVKKAGRFDYEFVSYINSPRDVYLTNDMDRPIKDYLVQKADSANVTIGNHNQTLRSYLANLVRQDALPNLTLEAQGLGEIQFAPKQYGVTRAVQASDLDITEDDIQMYKRISDGEPQDYLGEHEVVVSFPNLVSYRRFKPATTTINGDTLNPHTNARLPMYGVEARYGLEEINYPSIWSERLTVNALWENAKLGIILPTSPLGFLTEDLYSQERRLVHGGFGINAGLDFPIMLAPGSGIFSFSGSYMFGDAQPAEYRTRDLDPLTPENLSDLDYTIRYTAMLYYSFAVSIDKNHFFRFKFGGGVYNAESWTYRNEVDTATGSLEKNFRQFDDETRGGIAGRIEYMATGGATPYGFTLQFFDEALSGNAWLQIPLVRDEETREQWLLRLDGTFFTTPFRDPHAWEMGSIFMPSVRIIYNF